MKFNSSKRYGIWSLGAAALLFAGSLSAGVPAFYGAQGAGAVSVGGRGGAVLEVTNLNDSGPGSLRAAVSASGPRTVIFKVAGVIDLNSALRINNPYLTIAGQTAPGSGVTIKGTSVTDSAMIMTYTHDVIVRYIRIRAGKGNRPYGIGGDLSNFSGSYNNIFDHVSVTWSTDENLTVWRFPNQDPIHNLTYSYILNGEGISGHSTGFIAGGNDGPTSDGITEVDLHHSILTSSDHRNPLIKSKNFRMVSNINYNWGFYAAQTVGGVTADFIDNYFKPGPLAQGSHEIQVSSPQNSDCPTGSASIYAAGNKGPNNADPNADNGPMLALIGCENCSENGLLPAQYRRGTPQGATAFPISADPADHLEALLLNEVGASKRLDENGKWVPARDAADARLIQNYLAGQGFVPNSEAEVGGYPAVDPGTPYADADHDGMPDAWEAAHGLNPNDPSDAKADADGDGFTNLEEFLNGTDPHVADGPGGAPAPAAAAPQGAMPPQSVEAETATLIGDAKSEPCNCSGNGAVGYVGAGRGAVQFNVSVPAAGQYKVTVYYATGGSDAGSAQLAAGGGAAAALTMPASGGWNNVASITTTLALNAGQNAIVYSNPSAWAPDIDRIVVGQ